MTDFILALALVAVVLILSLWSAYRREQRIANYHKIAAEVAEKNFRDHPIKFENHPSGNGKIVTHLGGHYTWFHKEGGDWIDTPCDADGRALL